ncbi:MAG: class I SAM-dependent methyltransferase [Verrucomicrobia bacterium]|nr:class I SAM-dependent methyltransferase [Verrucomicrobiota bacterium]
MKTPLLLIFTLIVLTRLLLGDSDLSKPLQPSKLNTARLLLTELRQGDYAHAGDKEAILLVIKKALEFSPEIQKKASLDVGSGFGGTANYIYNLGFPNLYGIDLDKAAIEYAKSKYPHVHFLEADATSHTTFFDKEFSFIYSFNVLYAIEDKDTLLRNLYDMAEPGALLVLFDYTTENPSLSLKDLADKPMYPMVLKEMKKTLQDIGWQILEIQDLSSEFLFWYQDLLDKMEKNEETLTSLFSKADINKVKATFSTIYHWLKTSQLGGAAIYAKKLN